MLPRFVASISGLLGTGKQNGRAEALALRGLVELELEGDHDVRLDGHRALLGRPEAAAPGGRESRPFHRGRYVG